VRFPTRIMGLVPVASHTRQVCRSAGRRRSPLQLERLETRDLMATTLPGVSVSNLTLLIQAPKPSGNVAVVSIDPSNHNIELTLNGQSEEFSPTVVYHVTYAGGSGGGDTFTDNTSLESLEYGYGSGNHFTGGSSYNYAFFYGNNNTFNGAAGLYSDVFEYGGTNDTIVENQLNDNVAVYT
jgi:hypothetical protein